MGTGLRDDDFGGKPLVQTFSNAQNVVFSGPRQGFFRPAGGILLPLENPGLVQVVQ